MSSFGSVLSSGVTFLFFNRAGGFKRWTSRTSGTAPEQSRVRLPDARLRSQERYQTLGRFWSLGSDQTFGESSWCSRHTLEVSGFHPSSRKTNRDFLSGTSLHQNPAEGEPSRVLTLEATRSEPVLLSNTFPCWMKQLLL